jgi:tetratricopeptide (TPR) repeat protein
LATERDRDKWPLDRNELSGTVHGSAVQARTIQGDVHFSIAQSAPPPMPVPAQLPPVPANFTDRTAELAILDRLAADYEPARRLVVIVITGAGGTGKTSLGSYWLHRVSEGYEGGALYADLAGHQPDTAANPGDVLSAFLRSLGTPPEQIPVPLNEQAAFYRSVTSGRRILLLLDNAASAAQVRALIPGPGRRPAVGSLSKSDEPERPTVVIVTSRWRIAGLATEGAHFIDIGSLDDASATTLLDRIVGPARTAAERDAARSIVRLCAGLPLAVCVAGARLASHAKWPVSRIAADLAREKDRLAALSITEDLSVRAAFDASYRALPTGVRRLYRLLSLAPGPGFSLELAAAIADADPARARQMLDALAEGSLLEETGHEHYRFHDLIRLHASEQVRDEPEGERRAAFTRAITWYLENAIAADLVIHPRRWRLNPMYDQARALPPAYDSPADALRWLESELSALLAAIRAAYDQGLYKQAWQLCEAMWGFFSNRNYFQPWTASHQLGIEAARADGNRQAEARVRAQLGLAHLHLGWNREAREQYAAALALDRAEQHRIGEATALEHLGLVDLADGLPDDAIGNFTQALAIFQDLPAPRGAAMMICHIGEAHRAAGRYPDAARELAEARLVFATLPDPYNEARALTELGLVHLAAGKPDTALQPLSHALDAMTSLDSPYEQARIRVALADVALDLHQYHQARSHLEQALDVYDRLGAPEADPVRRKLLETAWPEG